MAHWVNRVCLYYLCPECKDLSRKGMACGMIVTGLLSDERLSSA